ncbi:hydroxylysine kinase-like [Acropora millepora]|uniref:hydroxylysine kinase-like n=1 Tax=Acropora millepora TaxID=45264 RepID=UPI001CF1B35B|nr:hydroxylysine kinase-like [Acropora millepora]XP_029179354.2 hydroxylysine kinase-like [Acropora millepora]
MDSKLNFEERDAKIFRLTGGLIDLKRPIVDKDEATELASLLFGLRVSDQLQVREFDSYDDRNYYMRGTLTHRPANENTDGALLQANEDEFVLKILNNLDSENLPYVNAQNEMMLYLNARGFNCPVPMQSLKGPYTLLYKSKSSEEKMGNKEVSYREHAVRLLSFVPGRLIKDVSCTTDLLFDLGTYVSKIHIALQGFHHAGIGSLVKREWDLSQLFVLESYITVASQNERELEVFQNVYKNFIKEVIPQLGNLEKHVIHGDLNDDNILVVPRHNGNGHEIASVLDFGDVSFSYRVFDIAICMMYMILLRVKQGDPHKEAIRAVGHLLSGYQSVNSLTELELSLLYWSVAGRLLQSTLIGRCKQSLEPENVYVSQVSKVGFDVLSSYIRIKREEVLDSWLLIGSSQSLS